MSGTFQAGTVETTFSEMVSIPQSAPVLRAVQASTQDAFAALITLLSTTREVTHLQLRFNTTPAVRLSCGTVKSCFAEGKTLSLDVRSEFDQWFASETAFGSLSTLKIPLFIDGSVHGTVDITLRNSQGFSNAMSLTLP